jgi:hypothetical protein
MSCIGRRNSATGRGERVSTSSTGQRQIINGPSADLQRVSQGHPEIFSNIFGKMFDLLLRP